MNHLLFKYKNDITKVFGIGVDVLNSTRQLKSISLDLKLLAINGIVQAAKIGNNQGQSLITLSAFLSDLPTKIAPELDELEKLVGHLSRQITICSIAVRRFMMYNMALAKTIDRVSLETGAKTNSTDFKLMNVYELSRISSHESFSDAKPISKSNLHEISLKNEEIMETLIELLRDIHTTISRARNRIEEVRRDGSTANYMGSSISIESAYLTDNSGSFDGLVSNIKKYG